VHEDLDEAMWLAVEGMLDLLERRGYTRKEALMLASLTEDLRVAQVVNGTKGVHAGVGKSSVTDELARRGYRAVDADGDAFSEWVDISDELAQAAGSPVEADRDWCGVKIALPSSWLQRMLRSYL